MSDINKINLTNVKVFKVTFENEKSNFNTQTNPTFYNGYISTCSDYIVQRMESVLASKYSRIKEAYQKIENWWDSYVENLEGLENALSNNGRTGTISESLLRNYVESQLQELPDYFPDFTKLQFKESSNLDFAATVIADVRENNKELNKEMFEAGKEAISNLGANIGDFFSNISNSFEKTGAKESNYSESVWANISNWWDNASDFLNKTGAKIKSSLGEVGNKIAGLFAENNNETKNTGAELELLDVANPENDKNGLFEKTTLFDSEGSRIIYDSLQNFDDGTIEYYADNGKIIKKVYPDGTCEIFKIGIATSSDYYYNPDGGKVGGAWIYGLFGRNDNISKIVLLPDGTKEYISFSGRLLLKVNTDGSYEEFYNYSETFSDELVIKKQGFADGSYITYDNNGRVKKQVASDGSYIMFNSLGEIVEKGLEDGSILSYYSNGKIKIEQKNDGVTIRYNEEGQITEIEYDGGPLRGGISEHYSDGKLIQKYINSHDNCEYYDSNGNVIALKDGDTYKIYNTDGSVDIYDKSQVIISLQKINIKLDDGKQRVIQYGADNTEYIYDPVMHSNTYVAGENQTVVDYGHCVSREKLEGILTHNGINISSENLPSNCDTLVNYTDGKVSSVQVINAGITSRYNELNNGNWVSFIENYIITPDGKTECTAMFFELKDGISSYDVKDILKNPEQYIEKLFIETKTEI